MKREIQLSVPNLDMEIVDNLRECIETGWVSTGGRFIAEFEEKIARYVGVKEAVSMQSGTAALHTALRVLGVKPGDEVIVPTLTFIAAVNPVTYMGASPIFMDCDDTLCMDAYKLEQFCAEECDLVGEELRNLNTGKRVAAVIPVHIFGNLCDMERIMDIAEKYHLKVLEDATEALGSYYLTGRYEGLFAGTIGDIGAYSFNANKIITTGGGGMIVSNHEKYLQYARYLGVQAKNDTLYFVHDEVGYNYRMLNLQAALGVSQIDKLESFIKTKMEHYSLYKKKLDQVNGLRILTFNDGLRTNHWFYSLLVEEEAFGESRNQLMHRLIEKGIQCRPIWKLIHTQKSYLDCQAYKIEKANYYVEHILNIPCSTNLTEEDVTYVCDRIQTK
ncbi:MAG: LegC family aminotransferase [Anaerovorax sp.]|nr:LegC family aminotransferase [Anaerovorax sp.]